MNSKFRKHVSVMLACMMILTGAMPATVFAQEISKVDSDTVIPVEAGGDVPGSAEDTYAPEVEVDGNVETSQDISGGDIAPSVKANGKGKSVTVDGNVKTEVTASSASDLDKVDWDEKPDQEGYSAVAAYNNGKVSVEGDAGLDMDFTGSDEGTAENVAISGVDSYKNGEITVGGNVSVRTGIDPYLHVKPDAEATPFDPYPSLLGHYSMGVNNEGGNVEVGKNVSVEDSHYAIGVDAGEKYIYGSSEYYDLKPEDYDEMRAAFDKYMEDHLVEDAESEGYVFTGNIDELIDAVAAKYSKGDSVSTVTVGGNVDAKGGMYSKGTYTRSNGNVTINGNITSGVLDVEIAEEDKEAREEAVKKTYTYEDICRDRKDKLEQSEEYQEMTPAQQEAAKEQLRRDVLAELMGRTTGVNNQGIVAQGFAGVTSQDVREELLNLMKKLDPTYDPETGESDFEKEIIYLTKNHKGLTNVLPVEAFQVDLDPEYESDVYKQIFTDVMKAAMAKGDRTTVKVKGDVTASGAKITKSIMALDSEVEVGGKVNSDGLAAAGIVSIGDDADVSASSVNAAGDNAAVGVASFGGNTNVDDEVVVSSGKEGTGIMLRGGNVTVGSDVTVNADKSTGIRTIALDNRMVTVMGLNNSEGDEWYSEVYGTYYGEAIWNCLNRYSDEMNVGDLLSYFINNDSSQSVVVDGTVKADNGVSVVSKADAAKLTEDYVVNMYVYRKGEGYIDADKVFADGGDPREMRTDELKEAFRNADNYDLKDLYRTCLALREIGAEEDTDPDVTVWRIDAKNTVNKGRETLSWKDFLNNWTFTMPNYESRYGESGKEYWDNIFNSTVEIDHSKDADRIQKGINYIIRIGSVTGGDGNISLNGTRKHNGFDTAREGESVTVYVKCAEGYEVKSISGLFASLVKNPDGSYTLIVPEGGGVQIDAVLQMIKKNEEEEQKKEEKKEQKPEQKKEVQPEQKQEEQPEQAVQTTQSSGDGLRAAVESGMNIGLVLSGEKMDGNGNEKALWDAMERLEQADPYYSASYLASKDADARKANIEEMAKAGYSLIFCVGDDMASVVEEMAKKYPEQSFVLVNSKKADGSSLEKDNIANVMFTDEGKAMSSGFTDAQMDLALGEVCGLRRSGNFDAKTRSYDAKDQSKNTAE